MKIKIIVSSLLFTTSILMGQIKSISYQLDYNAITKLYDVSLVVNEGEAHRSKDRIQFNAQIALITPSNCNLEVVKSYMPLIDNRMFTGKEPLDWEVSNFLRGATALNNNAVYGISPKLNKTSFYNNLNEGDKVKLFSIEIYPIPSDKSSVRLFSNKSDATSAELDGSDFRNGFTLGSVYQLYQEKPNIPNYDEPSLENNQFSSIVYPNPVVNNIYINVKTPLDEKVNIMIYNAEGKLVKKSSTLKTPGMTTISQDMQQFSPGLYTITVGAMSQHQEHKVIVMNK